MPAIGVDHIQFSVPEIAAAVPVLQARGWTLMFEEPEFVTDTRPYFRETGKSIAFLKLEQAAIELINGSSRQGPDVWTPVFSSRWPDCNPAPVEAAGPRHRWSDAERVQVDTLGGPCRNLGRDEASTELVGLILHSSAPSASASFLESLGFQPDPECNDQLTFPGNFFGMPLMVTIAARSGDPPHDNLVDDLGMSLVALISKDLAADAASLREAGHHVTAPFEYSINGRPIANVIVTGPGGELVELIQIGRA